MREVKAPVEADAKCDSPRHAPDEHAGSGSHACVPAAAVKAGSNDNQEEIARTGASKERRTSSKHEKRKHEKVKECNEKKRMTHNHAEPEHAASGTGEFLVF
eukprot:GHVU01175823.1.p1 GENE.GHVU01175823.1~~GHVU01175823.1.p1  ORF type:complete len:102 (+),score=20.58 GHVU01175823.1:445-750(+)